MEKINLNLHHSFKRQSRAQRRPKRSNNQKRKNKQRMETFNLCKELEKSLNVGKEEYTKLKEEAKPNVAKRINDQEELGQMMAKWTKVILCQEVVFNRVCGQGEKCKFAHSPQILHENRLKQVGIFFTYFLTKYLFKVPFYKSELCEYHVTNNICPFGETCMFAHSHQELRNKQ